MEKIASEADQFVRIRLGRVDLSDLNLFEFDYDLTFMVFFLNAHEKIYARYGARDATDADARQSLEGLRYTMQSVLQAHKNHSTDFAPLSSSKPFFVREETGVQGGHCLHCHQVKERINRKIVSDGDWSRDHVYRYPLPDNIGVILDVDRGNMVEKVISDSPAQKAGIRAGDRLAKIGTISVHSIADASFALDKAPLLGSLSVEYYRDGKLSKTNVLLGENWKKSDISWRPSMRFLKPNFAVYGPDLTSQEKAKLNLEATRLAFRQSDQISEFAKTSGIKPNDIILGLEGQKMHMDVDQFVRKIQREYLVGDTITVEILRDNKPMRLTLVLKGR